MSGRRDPTRRDPPAFLFTRLLRWGVAELLALLGNVVPVGVAIPLWGWTVRLNRHHETAAANRALALLERGDPRAWAAFEHVLTQLDNPWETSASDLHLSRAPGRFLRRLASRLLWGRAAAPPHPQHDAALQRTCRRLAEAHFRRALAASDFAVPDFAVADRALAAWRSLAGDGDAVRWGAVELAWARGTVDEAASLAAPLVERGRFPSPLDALRWGERWLGAHQTELARGAAAWARRYVPEEPRTWRLLAALAEHDGDRDAAAALWERALALDPQDVATFLARLAAGDGRPLPVPAVDVSLTVEAPATLTLGESGTVVCRLPPGASGWTLYPLPPAGWGLLPAAARVPFDDRGGVAVAVAARRPDRVRGGAWPLVLVAVGPGGWTAARCAVRVADPAPGRVLVTVTEDHEVQEERGRLAPALLREVLVDKSRFAADLGVPWTHMVETGSTLATTAWAAEQGGAWQELAAAVRRHLAEEAARGRDLQPHLHTFNDPAYGHFPYAAADDGWRPHLRFLLTDAAHRGDWASVCPPPGGARREPAALLDRLASVERAVAQLEAAARLGDPDHRAVLWRSGLLDYGDTPGDRAWSAVALRRAGILADSDLPKPGSPLAGAVAPAFACGWEEPFTPRPGGPLLQLPIVANLEGDYLMGPRLLRRRVRRCVAAVEGAGGAVRPGVHLFTVLTHDKFLNARRGRDEHRLDPEYGDWPTVRGHAAAWRAAGAELVTAREGVAAVLDDLAWRPVPWLEEETFVAGVAGDAGDAGDSGTSEVRYRLRVLGRGIPASEDFPQHLLVPVPCSLRRSQGGQVTAASWRQDGRERELTLTEDGTAAWLRRTAETPITVRFRLREPLGPQVRVEAGGDGAWRLELTSALPFLRARLLVGWGCGLPDDPEATWQARAEAGPDGAGNAVPCRSEAEGVLLTELCFAGAGDAPVPLRLELRRVAAVAESGP